MRSTFFTIALLLLFGGVLSAQPKAAGEPKVVAQMNEPLRMPVWSSNGATLLMTSIANDGVWTVDGNGKNFRQISAEKGAGSQLRVATGDAAKNDLLRRMIEDPANIAAQLAGFESFKNYFIFNPVLSPKGDKIVFQVNNGKGLYICNADGSDIRNLGQGERASWTPDGKYVIVMVVADNGEVVTKGELICINVASGTRTTLLSSDKYIALSPAVSPDGKHLAFEEYASGAVYVMDIK
jgi:Tol biopolymer transport system component